MNLFININNIQIENVFFLETKKNIIINGNFTKIAYYDPLVSMNGLYIYFPIQIDKNTNKYQLSFDINNPDNIDLITNIIDFENKILQYFRKTYSIPYSKKIFSIFRKLNSGKLKLYKDYQTENNKKKENNKHIVILKISGIWENENEFGITCKFLEGIIH